MSLTPAERATIVEHTLRGLEANLIQAEILADADPAGQNQRVEIIKRQIDAAQKRLDDYEKEQAAAEKAEVEDTRQAAARVVENATFDHFAADDYEKLDKAGLLDRARIKGILHLTKSSDSKDMLITLLRAHDLAR